jgi:hypothetical protein
MSTTSDGKVTLSAAVPTSLKERVQHIANERRWTLSQTLVIFLEEYLDIWEDELGVTKKQSTPKKPEAKPSKRK